MHNHLTSGQFLNDYYTGGPSGEMTAKKLGNRIGNPGRTQLTGFTLLFGFTHTRGGLKGGGALGCNNFGDHSSRYSLPLRRRSSVKFLTRLGAYVTNVFSFFAN